MTRRKFNADLAVAVDQPVKHVSHISKGDDDGQVDFTYANDALTAPLPIRMIALDIDGYPDSSGFLAYTDSEDVPQSLLDVLNALPDSTGSKSVLDSLRLLSRQLTAALQSDTAGEELGSDLEMTDMDADDGDEHSPVTSEEDEEDYDYNFDDDDNTTFGLESTMPRTSSGSGTKITTRLVEDLRKAKQAGFKIGLLTDPDNGASDGLFSLSLPIKTLCLPQETLEAWEIESSDYLVLLCRFDAGYPPLDTFAQLPPGSDIGMHFRFGACATFKPCYTSAISAFLSKASTDKGTTTTIDDDRDNHATTFRPLYVSNSIDMFMQSEFATLLKLRLDDHISWDAAKEKLDSMNKLAHVRANKKSPSGKEKKKKKAKQKKCAGADDEALVLASAPSVLNQDFVFEDPKVQDPIPSPASSPSSERSLPLIAMQFALRYFVKSTQYCMVCHRKSYEDFEAIKPYVCDEPLCLYQYLSLGFGPSIEHEIIRQPCVVDLLISFCYAALVGNRLREYPQGLGVKVPVLTPYCPPNVAEADSSASQLPYPTPKPSSSGQGGALPNLATSVRVPVRVRMSEGQLTFVDPKEQRDLQPGDMFVLTRPISVKKGDVAVPDGLAYHCRSKTLVFNGTPKTVDFDYLASSNQDPLVYLPAAVTATTTAAAQDLPDGEIFADMYLYEHDLDELPEQQQRKVLAMLLETLPPVRELRDLLQVSGSTLSGCQRISRPAAVLLRWVVASNRSLIVQIDDHPGLTGDEDGSNRSRDKEKLVGLDKGWIQFRFSQASPEKEQRFSRELQATKSGQSAHPTIFSWHGSALGNWHSIIRVGLDYKETLNGRAFGNGVYFSNLWSTSAGYCHSFGGSGSASSWPNSALRVSAAISLCEILNRKNDFVSANPYYVVPNVDWIQCRYLIVKVADAPDRKEAPAPLASKIPGISYVSQPEGSQAIGPKNIKVEIPVQALSRRRPQNQKLGVSSSRPIVIEDGDSDDESDDLDKFIQHREECRHGAESTKKSDVPSTSTASTLRETDFVPGTLDVSSLPKLPNPTWASGNSRKVLTREVGKLQKIQSQTPLGELGWYIDFENIDNMFQWIVELHSFDASLPLAQDMKTQGVTSIVLEIRFGREYPLSPPFVRVIRPRFRPFSERGGGHVTAGGAMCMELLTNSGWSPANSMESVLIQIRMALCNLEPFPARLASSGSSQADYGIFEAIEAYRRAASAHGWQIPKDLNETANGG